MSASSVVDPDWLHKPSGEDLAEYYPALPASLGLGGRAMIACDITTTGALRDCVVASEAPRGLGFGQAALKLAPKFRMTPRMLDGVPVEGDVRIPIVFRLPSQMGPAPYMGLTGLIGALLLILLVFALLDRRAIRAGAPAAPLTRTLSAGLAFVVHAWRTVPLALLLYVATVGAYYYLTGTYGDEHPWAVLSAVSALAASVVVYGACYRAALSGLAPERQDLRPRWLGLTLGIVEGRLIAASLVTGLWILLAGAAIMVVGMLIAFAVRSGFPALDPLVVMIGLAAVGAAILSYVWARLFVVIPAVIHRVDKGYGEAWRMTRGGALTCLVATVVQAAVALAPMELAAWAMELAGMQYTMTAVWVVGATTLLSLAVALPLYVGLSSYAYMALRSAKAP